MYVYGNKDSQEFSIEIFVYSSENVFVEIEREEMRGPIVGKMCHLSVLEGRYFFSGEACVAASRPVDCKNSAFWKAFLLFI